MTVANLIELLSRMPQSAVVVIAKDAEGNEFSPADMLCTGTYAEDSPYSGGFHHDDEPTTAPVAVCLWPAN